jgi:SpoVK/Ycf46/Vps4 family AAA+-type ATPase
VSALNKLSNFSTQSRIVTKTTDIVAAFLKNPKLFRTKLMNFMMMGGAGTGKTSIAEAIGDVFARAGIFVGNQLIEAGRAELVGQYEGQTVARTRNFLVSNLDNGVIFIDEAYAITPWQDGKPEGYGSEAATAMVEFMTRYPGLYCIIVAGYEKEMTRYFLPTNEGMSRRFPNKFVLRDMTADDLMTVFKRAMLKAQGLPVPDGRGVRLESEDYFTKDAWAYLRALIERCTHGTTVYVEEEDKATRKVYKRVRVFQPTWELMYQIFENQAGSMTNLADEAVTVLMTTIRFADVVAAHKAAGDAPPPIRRQDRSVMRDIVQQRVLNAALSEADAFLAQLEQVESLI